MGSWPRSSCPQPHGPTTRQQARRKARNREAVQDQKQMPGRQSAGPGWAANSCKLRSLMRSALFTDERSALGKWVAGHDPTTQVRTGPPTRHPPKQQAPRPSRQRADSRTGQPPGSRQKEKRGAGRQRRTRNRGPGAKAQGPGGPQVATSLGAWGGALCSQERALGPGQVG